MDLIKIWSDALTHASKQEGQMNRTKRVNAQALSEVERLMVQFDFKAVVKIIKKD